jgi:hydroxyacylglutathione hydrolase
VLVESFPAGPPATNCFVVAPGPGERCVVVDPGIDAVDQLDDVLARHRLRPAAVLLTHGHLDHTFSVVPSLPTAEPADLRALADGDTLELAGLSLGVRHTPGHTLGSVVFTLDGPDAPLLFAGDLLFAGSIGRTDLPGGSYPAMLDSLARVVLPMDDATVVHPGHGPDTTIGRERATNPYLKL